MVGAPTQPDDVFARDSAKVVPLTSWGFEKDSLAFGARTHDDHRYPARPDFPGPASAADSVRRLAFAASSVTMAVGKLGGATHGTRTDLPVAETGALSAIPRVPHRRTQI